MNSLRVMAGRWVTRLCLGVALAQAAPADRFTFREPQTRVYQIVPAPEVFRFQAAPDPARPEPAPAWVRARSEIDPDDVVDFGSRLVVQVAAPDRLAAVLDGATVRLDRQVGPGLVVLQASDALAAMREAARLATLADVTLSHPVRRRQVGLHASYASRPNDPRFPQAWHLENRDPNTAAWRGHDLNVRAAWPLARGAGVVVAVADNGVEITHPDLSANGGHLLHYNFHSKIRDGRPMTTRQAHGTAVAGLIAAVQNNERGASGVAPEARFASWIIFDSLDLFLDEETAMDMFQYETDAVWVQNHSWGNVGVRQLPLGALENAGIENAITRGRHGRGVILVRAAGNERPSGNNTNDDGYAQDPRVITVAAVRSNGQVSSYSTPGANVLVAAFSGDDRVELPGGTSTNHPSLFTTDRTGSLGYNRSGPGDSSDYAFDSSGFTGTSGSTPQIAGLGALLLSINPGLTWRDVQQILILASQPLHREDPDLQVNGAGLLVSHHVGFGIPDAGLAVRLARDWQNRPERTSASASLRATRPIPDDGLRVRVSGLRLPIHLESIPAFPIDGPHPDDPTESLRLVHLGQALSPIKDDLTGRAALIQRGGNYFVEKLRHAADAGAAFAVLYNNQGVNERMIPSGADIHFTPIPAVFIDQEKGEALADHLRLFPGNTRAQLRLDTAVYQLTLDEPLLCEHVRVRIDTSHARRADLRVTLVSPSGTRSILQHTNQDTLSPLDTWEFYSVLHHFEPAAGTWRLEVSDQKPGVTGSVRFVELTVFGTRIKDSDRDGLDDDWELFWFGSLDYTARDDLNGDGASNGRHQALGTNPVQTRTGNSIGLARWDDRILRLSWPGLDHQTYRVRVFDTLSQPPFLIEDVPGRFPETTWFGPAGAGTQRFFSVETVPDP